MAVTNSNAYSGPYVPNGVTTSFPFTFKALDASEVALIDEFGNFLGSQPITVSLSVNSEGGSVTFGAPPTTDSIPIFAIISAPAFGITANLGSVTAFNPRSLNPSFDRLAVQNIFLKQGLDSAIKMPAGQNGATLPPAEYLTGGNKVLGPDPVTGAIAVLDGSHFQGSQGVPGRDADELWRRMIFRRALGTLATGQTVFPIPFTYLPNVSVVSLNGSELVEGEDYDASGGPIILTDPITEYNDDLIVRLLDVAAVQELRERNIAQIGMARAKLLAGSVTTIALQGDSIPYCQDTVSAGLNPPINGSTATRSPERLELRFAEALASAGCTASVINRGFPGDSTIEGLTRWAEAAAVDMKYHCYGLNDAHNFGGYPHGPITVAAYIINYAALIARDIMQGTGVNIVLPPRLLNPTQERKVQAYRAAVRALALRFGCDIFDLDECFQTLTSPWTDGVHSASFANVEWAWMMAAQTLGGEERGVHDGDIFYADDGIFLGGSITIDARSRSNKFLEILPGQSVVIAARVQDNVRPILNLYQDANDCELGIYYAGGPTGTGGLPVSVLVHDPDFPAAALVGPWLRPGMHYLAARNDGDFPIYVESLTYTSRATSMTRGALRRAEGMTGVFQPKRVSAAATTFWMYADWSVRLTTPFRMVSDLELGAVGLQAVVLWYDPPVITGDFVSGTGLVVARDGTDLKIYELVNFAPTTPTVAAAVFSGAFSGEIEVEAVGTEIRVYVDGVLKATRTGVSPLIGVPGLLAAKLCTMKCRAMYVSGEVKGPY